MTRMISSYRVNMSEIISTSVSAAAIFCSELILGWPPKRNDIVMVSEVFWGETVQYRYQHHIRCHLGVNRV